MDEEEGQPLLRHRSRYQYPDFNIQQWMAPYLSGISTRESTRRFLSSKYGHYSVLLLVSLDVSCIFLGMPPA
jgi:NADH:ubiquinone oxidoreductase subunit 3 (subunit A)